ncbi:MAG TPA: hypothetical protein VFC00_36810 [Micromonosporaceae bacterium]|nr:hypothetical protein [Micromonosporaceae bacterium]
MISRARFGSIAGGVAVAVAVLVVLALAGVFADTRRRPPPPEGALDPGPAVAYQPELERALLAESDLPAPPTSEPSAARRPTTRGSMEALLGDTCSTLFERLGAIAGAVTRSSTGPLGSQLRQALAVLPTTAQAGAVLRTHRLATNCRPFAAVLDDGTHVRVESAPASLAPLLLPADAELTTIQLLVTGPGRVLEGYLTLARVGRIVSVLRMLGPHGAVTPGVAVTLLGRAVDKLVPLDIEGFGPSPT